MSRETNFSHHLGKDCIRLVFHYCNLHSIIKLASTSHYLLEIAKSGITFRHIPRVNITQFKDTIKTGGDKSFFQFLPCLCLSEKHFKRLQTSDSFVRDIIIYYSGDPYNVMVIEGEIMSILRELKFLDRMSVDIHGFDIYGVDISKLLSPLSERAQLTWLDLGYCSLANNIHPIPSTIVNLSQFTKLKRLYLHLVYNASQLFPAFSSLINLSNLSLGGTNMNKLDLISLIKYLVTPELQILYLWDNRLQEIEPLAEALSNPRRWSQLKLLDLHGNAITSQDYQNLESHNHLRPQLIIRKIN